MKSAITACALLFIWLVSTPARAEVLNCIEIASLPAVITVQGVHCLKHDLSTTLAAGSAITVNTNNVIIDLNGFKLGGLAAPASMITSGVFAVNRQNITIRNGTIRGFYAAIYLDDSTINSKASSGHVIEDLKLDANRRIGIYVKGSYNAIRNNSIVNTGGHPNYYVMYGIALKDGTGNDVSHNRISNVQAATAATGISIDGGVSNTVRHNVVVDINAPASSRGIDEYANWSVLEGSRIINSTQGGVGLSGAGPNTACIGNFVANYSVSIAGPCEYSQDNGSL
jgi:hypothetical protein